MTSRLTGAHITQIIQAINGVRLELIHLENQDPLQKALTSRRREGQAMAYTRISTTGAALTGSGSINHPLQGQLETMQNRSEYAQNVFFLTIHHLPSFSINAMHLNMILRILRQFLYTSPNRSTC